MTSPLPLTPEGPAVVEPASPDSGFAITIPKPREIAAAAAAIVAETAANQMPPEPWRTLTERLDSFVSDWQHSFERFGRDAAGELSYEDLRSDFEDGIVPAARAWLREGAGCAALAALGWSPGENSAPSVPDSRQLAAARRAVRRRNAPCRPPEFDRPIFIISAPRSGSTLLFESLAALPHLWTVGGESHELIEGIPELHPAARGYTSNRLTAADATGPVVAALHERFAKALRDRAGRAFIDLVKDEPPKALRFLEKTPKNILRIPFLCKAFPGARFVVLIRRPEETLASMLEGWRSSRFVAYRPLPGWPHRAWKFLLVPGWESLAYRPLAEVVAYQWRMAYETLLADLARLPAGDWQVVRYADLVAEPLRVLRRVTRFAELESDPELEQRLEAGLPWSSMTFSAPDPDKWRRHETALAPVLPGLRDLEARLEALDRAPGATAAGAQGVPMP
ncbi:MAG: sulfotransferase family protein [Methylococcus sp.]